MRSKTMREFLLGAAVLLLAGPASATWLGTYDLLYSTDDTSQSSFQGSWIEVTNTPIGGAGNDDAGIQSTGLGSATVLLEFLRGAAGPQAGDVVFLTQLVQDQFFQVATGGAPDVFSEFTIELGRSGATNNVWPRILMQGDLFDPSGGTGETTQPVTPAIGIWTGTSIDWGDQTLTDYSTYGAGWCDGLNSTCRAGGFADGNETPKGTDSYRDDVIMANFLFDSSGDWETDVQGIQNGFRALDQADTFLHLKASLNSFVFVPEPGTALLLLSGLAGLAIIGRMNGR
jgi:hypothetical protein